MTQPYRKKTVHGHHYADAQGHVSEHVLIAEKALGKPLPKGTHVHHVDEDGLNNAGRNLVICQDAAYHKLLHHRMRVLRAGGDPNRQKICALCRAVKDLGEFNIRRGDKCTGRQNACRECLKTYNRTYVRPSKRTEAAA